MADRVSVSIAIGGDIAATLRDAFVATIIDQGLSTEWDGPAFDAAQFPEEGALMLYAHEVAWGRLDALEAFCVKHGLPFARWSDGYPGEWGGERLVFTGAGKPDSYGATSGDLVTVDRHTAERLGSYTAILAYFTDADFAVPALRLLP